MDIKTISVAFVAIMVGAVAFGAMLPIFQDVTATEDTFTNEGYFFLDKFTSDDEYTVYWDSTTPDTFTINGETYKYTNNSGLGLSIVLGESFYLRLQNGNTRISFNNNGTYINTSESYPTMTLTYSGGTVTATNGSSSRSVSDVSEIFGITEKGPYVMKKSTATAYLNSGSEIVADSEIYASGQSSSGNNNLFWHMEGTIDNIEYPDTFNENLTVTNEVIHGGYDSSHEDLYKLDNLTFTVTTSASVVYNITASYFVVPYEVTADRTIQGGDGFNTIVNLIPLVIGMGLLLIAVWWFVVRKF